MKTTTYTLAAILGTALTCSLQTAFANGPGMNMPAPKTNAAPRTKTTTPRVHVNEPYHHGPHYVPPVVVRTPPRIVTVVPVVPTVTVVPSTPFGFGGGKLASGAWVGYNPQTGRYSIAFDSPGVSGLGILINAGYSVSVMGPTTWTGARAYLKSIGAPGW